MKVWISKYALAKGIYEEDVRDCFNISPTMVSTLGNGWEKYSQCFHNGEWHYGKQDAIAKANSMREKKIASLKKQIKKLEEMTFE